MKGYIEKNLKIGYIRLSKSLARYSILFMPKKDSKL